MTQRNFWYPLSIWKVLAIFAAAQILAQLVTASVYTLIGASSQPAGGAAAGGFLGVAIVTALARRQQSTNDATDAS